MIRWDGVIRTICGGGLVWHIDYDRTIAAIGGGKLGGAGDPVGWVS